MMSSLDLRGRTLDVRFLRRALPRAEFDVTAALEQVRPICEDVEHRGAATASEPTSASWAGTTFMMTLLG